MDIVKGIKGSPELNLVIEKIGNEYELMEYLGGGGFSHVYLIRHKLLGKKRALRVHNLHYRECPVKGVYFLFCAAFLRVFLWVE